MKKDKKVEEEKDIIKEFMEELNINQEEFESLMRIMEIYYVKKDKNKKP